MMERLGAVVSVVVLSACVTSGATPRASAGDGPCDRCQVVVENQTPTHVTVSYYGDGGRRVLGDLTGNSVASFEVLRPVARDNLTLVVGIDGRDWCRGVVDLPGRFVVGDRTSCKPDRGS